MSDVSALGESKSWYPLNVGNYWKYKESDGGEMKIVVNSTQTISGVLTYEVQRISVKGLFAGKGAYQTAFMNKKGDGIIIVAKKTTNGILEFKDPYYELNYPLQFGKTWENTPVYKNKPTNALFTVKVKSEIVSNDEIVNTLAGRFKATKVKVTIGKITYFRWYVLGLGLIKEVYQSSNTKREKVLMAYYIKPDY